MRFCKRFGDVLKNFFLHGGSDSEQFRLISRNGLRPSRFYVLKDNIMVMASEVGVYDTEPENVALKVSIYTVFLFHVGRAQENC